jgi:ATP-dependent Clp protease adaptor protein ClpS
MIRDSYADLAASSTGSYDRVKLGFPTGSKPPSAMSRRTMTCSSVIKVQGPLEGPLEPRLAGDDQKRPGSPGAPGTAVITKTKTQTKRPNLYRVLILNDDYTPMEFVVHILERFFNKDHESAYRIMMHVHQHGIGECGIYTYEVAETKVTQVMDFSRKHQHPLQCVMEKK